MSLDHAMSLQGLYALAVIATCAGVVACDSPTRISREQARREAARCVVANMTWTPVLDIFGNLVAIECDPDVPYIRAPPNALLSGQRPKGSD